MAKVIKKIVPEKNDPVLLLVEDWPVPIGEGRIKTISKHHGHSDYCQTKEAGSNKAGVMNGLNLMVSDLEYFTGYDAKRLIMAIYPQQFKDKKLKSFWVARFKQIIPTP